MTTSLSLVLASCLVGAGDPAPASGCGCSQGAITYPRYQTPAPQAGIINRLRNARMQNQQPVYSAPRPTTPMQAYSAPVAAAPAQATVQTVTAYRPSNQQLELPLAKKYEEKVGHEQDYSWITGHLFFVHADGGRWVVRYGLPGEVDKFGGSVVLAPGVEMRNFREGDLVCIRGDILNEDRTSPTLSGALYRVNTITMIERSDP